MRGSTWNKNFLTQKDWPIRSKALSNERRGLELGEKKNQKVLLISRARYKREKENLEEKNLLKSRRG